MANFKIPVDTKPLMIMCAIPPTPKMKDVKAGIPAVDAQTQEPLWVVQVTMVSLDGGGAEIVKIVTTEPNVDKHITPGAQLAVGGLTVSQWEISNDGRDSHGLSFRAQYVTAKDPAGQNGHNAPAMAEA
jgi:hypothetical protein